MVYTIVAYTTNRAIGLNNELPWAGDLPADMLRFKQLTSGNSVIMGRKTYQSIGHALPNRQNIVLSTNTDFSAPGCLVLSTIEEALKRADHEDVFVIGGASIYTLAEKYVDVLLATEIRIDIEGDTFFRFSDPGAWHEVSRISHKADKKNKYAYDFVEYSHEK